MNQFQSNFQSNQPSQQFGQSIGSSFQQSQFQPQAQQQKYQPSGFVKAQYQGPQQRQANQFQSQSQFGMNAASSNYSSQPVISRFGYQAGPDNSVASQQQFQQAQQQFQPSQQQFQASQAPHYNTQPVISQLGYQSGSNASQGSYQQHFVQPQFQGSIQQQAPLASLNSAQQQQQHAHFVPSQYLANQNNQQQSNIGMTNRF